MEIGSSVSIQAFLKELEDTGELRYPQQKVLLLLRKIRSNDILNKTMIGIIRVKHSMDFENANMTLMQTFLIQLLTNDCVKFK